MENKKLEDETRQSFPMMSKGFDKSYDFTEKYNPELASVLKQLFYILMKPFVAFRAKLYHLFFKPFSKLKKSSFPIFRLGIIIIGFTLLYYKNLSFTINIQNPVYAMANNGNDDLSYLDSESSSSHNDYAPVNVSEISNNAEDYIAQFKNAAIEEMKLYGIPASITLAQALIESNAGNSRLAKENNNHFGIKCFSKNCVKGHCTNHFDDHHKDFFRKYKSPWKSYRDHSKFLLRDRYKGLQVHGKDYKKWAVGLKKAGYATDKNYHNKLINVIKKYKLYQYDK